MIDYEKPILDKDGKPIKIGILGFHHCIRCIRIAESLKSVGYEVYGNGNKAAYGSNVYDSYFLFKDEKQFKHNVKVMIECGVKIFEWQNEPHHPAVWIREVINEMGKQDEIKLISNVHDSDMIRRDVASKVELEMIRVSDAVIYVSNPIQSKLNYIYNVTSPTMVLYNYPTKRMIDGTEVDWDNAYSREGMVYEGGINAISDSAEVQRVNSILKYRDLFPIFKRLIEMGNEVHAYSGNSDAYHSGQHTGVILHPPTEFDKLLQELTRFRYNLVIFNNENGTENQVNYTTANKIWDGLAAGVPSIACYCEEMQKYIIKHNIGISVNNLNDIKDSKQFDYKYNELVDSVRKKRKELIFENQIWRTENLYAEVLGVEKKGIPDNIKEQAIFEYGEDSVNKLLYIK